MNKDRVEACLERLCNKGCRSVWGDIEALEAGRPLAETRGLEPHEIRRLIRDLKEIMAVYEGNCSVS